MFKPDWRTRPIAVTSNNDGTIVACTEDAKILGVEKFQPWFRMKPICEKFGVVAVSSNYALYSDISDRLMNTLSEFAPESFIYSIDEQFQCLDNVKFKTDIYDHCQSMRQAAWRRVKIPVDCGVGDTLTLAKASSHAAKRLGHGGLFVMDSEQKRIETLAAMAPDDVWGVGRRIGKRLVAMGIDTALKLSKMPPKMARQQFNVDLERCVLELNGIRAKKWDASIANKQQIFSTRSVGNRITELDFLLQAFAFHVAVAMRKARQQGSVTSAITYFAHTSPFDQDGGTGFKRFLELPIATDDTTIISRMVADGVRLAFTPNTRYYKVGVGLLGLTDKANTQLDLFDVPIGNAPLMKTLDVINSRMGRDTMFFAAQGIQPKWAMKREMLTPLYTTRWTDIPKVIC